MGTLSKNGLPVRALVLGCFWFMACVLGAEAGTIPSSVDNNLYLNSYIRGHADFDSCKSHALRGHCSYYSCLDEALQCFGSKHKRSVAYRFCDRARHHHEDFTSEGQAWAVNTNRCVLKTIASGRDMERDAWCTQVDKITKRALVDCARSADICQVLWSDREAIYKVFSHRTWFTVVEAAKNCQRATVNRYIFWTLARMKIYKI